jgi:hypothetical protein
MVCLPLLLAPINARAEINNSGSEDLAAALITHGFENVLVADGSGGTVRVYYENRVYRYQLRAMGVVLALVNKRLAAPWTAEMIPLRAGVPIVSVVARADDYGRFVAGEIGEGDFAKSLAISTNPPAPDLKGSRNSSFGRFDISAGPSFTVELEQIDDAMRGQFNIVPQVEAALTKGVLTTAQLVVPVVDEFEEEASGVRPGRVTLDWLHRHGATVGLFRAGLLNPARYGLSLEAGGWAWEDRLLLTAKGDFTGKLALLEGIWEYSDISVFTYSIGAQYMYPFLDVAVTASFGRFLGEEQGGRLDLRRALGELEIGFYAIKTESESLGGILVDVPLPLNRYSKPSALRFKTVPSLTWEYRSKVTGVGRMPGGGQTVERLYKGLAPTFIRNNVSEWVDARRFIS